MPAKTTIRTIIHVCPRPSRVALPQSSNQLQIKLFILHPFIEIYLMSNIISQYLQNFKMICAEKSYLPFKLYTFLTFSQMFIGLLVKFLNIFEIFNLIRAKRHDCGDKNTWPSESAKVAAHRKKPPQKGDFCLTISIKRSTNAKCGRSRSSLQGQQSR